MSITDLKKNKNTPLNCATGPNSAQRGGDVINSLSERCTWYKLNTVTVT